MIVKDVDECKIGQAWIKFENLTQPQYPDNMYKWTPCESNISTCLNTPGSYECKCQPGYEKNEMGDSCLDIDECSLLGNEIGRIKYNCPLNSICENFPGGYKCECEPGYHNVLNRCEGILFNFLLIYKTFFLVHFIERYKRVLRRSEYMPTKCCMQKYTRFF